MSDNFFTKILNDHDVEFILEPNNPDVLIFTCFGNNHINFKAKKKVYYTAEKWMDREHANFVVGSLPTDLSRYMRIRNYERCQYFATSKYNIYQSLPSLEDTYPQKTKFCCWIVSNPQCWQRNLFFEMVSKYKKVDSIGRFKRNVDFVVPRAGTQEFLDLIGQYKFCICFENGSVKHWMSERLYRTFQAKTIPIYWGNPDASETTYNPNAYIHVKEETDKGKQIESMNEALKKIKELDQNEGLYEEMLKQPGSDKAKELDEYFEKNVKYLVNYMRS